MKYFSGFGFQNEWPLFKEYIQRGEYNIAGFSYGAQKAFMEAYERTKEGRRVQKLQLLSPAYFEYLPKEVKHKEILSFAKNPDLYMRFFYKKVLYPSSLDINRFKKMPTLGELKSLLLFHWEEEKFEFLQEKGVQIEVYLGSLDKIVDASKAHEFFKQYAISHLIKDVGHLLR